MSYLILVGVGFLSGVISGMGIGGGAILIPSLTIFLDLDQKLAQVINLIYFIPTALIALITHIKNKNIQPSKSLLCIIMLGVVGAIIGSLIATSIDSNLLKKFFGVFLLVIGLKEVFTKNKSR